jgi:4a-hydroxytetrahydrobiopterin dehydratase
MAERTKLSDEQIERGLAGLDGWSREGDEIVREFQFGDFVGAMGFIAQVGVLAERANHHPDLRNVYNRVRIALSTHDAGGITQRDFDLAKEISERA